MSVYTSILPGSAQPGDPGTTGGQVVDDGPALVYALFTTFEYFKHFLI